MDYSNLLARVVEVSIYRFIEQVLYRLRGVLKGVETTSLPVALKDLESVTSSLHKTLINYTNTCSPPGKLFLVRQRFPIN